MTDITIKRAREIIRAQGSCYHHEIEERAEALLERVASGEVEIHTNFQGDVYITPAEPERVRRIREELASSKYKLLRRPGVRR